VGDLAQREHPQNWGGIGVGSGAQNLQFTSGVHFYHLVVLAQWLWIFL